MADLVTTNQKRITVEYHCPHCEYWADEEIDLGDYANLNYGVTLQPTCNGCEKEFLVELC